VDQEDDNILGFRPEFFSMSHVSLGPAKVERWDKETEIDRMNNIA
jgi:hypothetical protein